MSPKIEICIDSPDEAAAAANARAAFHGGADRIELCSAMEQDGLSPTTAQVAAARRAFGRPGLMVMVRPRGGDFVYSTAEVKQMQRQIIDFAQLGADGIVLGLLRHDDEIDLEDARLSDLIELAKSFGLSTTFHRAFDAAHDRTRALDQLCTLGVDRVLTSGTAWASGLGASAGITQLRQTIAQAGDKLEIVVGGGVSPANAAPLLNQLAPYGRLSLHAYSSVLTNGQTDAHKVASLVQAAKKHSPTP